MIADSPDAGDHLEIGTRQHPSFLQRHRAEPQAVREDRPFRVGDRYLTEFHRAAAASPLRRTWVISATIEIATSAGEIAPMARPTGP